MVLEMLIGLLIAAATLTITILVHRRRKDQKPHLSYEKRGRYYLRCGEPLNRYDCLLISVAFEGETTGVPHQFIVDTGSQGSLIKASLFCDLLEQKIKFKPTPQRDIAGATESTNNVLSGKLKIRSYDCTMEDAPVWEVEFSILKFEEFDRIEKEEHIPIEGILGLDYLEKAGMIIDFTKKLVSFNLH